MGGLNQMKSYKEYMELPEMERFSYWMNEMGNYKFCDCCGNLYIFYRWRCWKKKRLKGFCSLKCLILYLLKLKRVVDSKVVKTN